MRRHKHIRNVVYVKFTIAVYSKSGLHVKVFWIGRSSFGGKGCKILNNLLRQMIPSNYEHPPDVHTKLIE